MSKAGKRPVGRPPKYTKKRLEEAVMKYFDSISYEVDAVNMKGETIYNKLGEPVKKLYYASPPSKLDLCLYLGIDRGTWLNYSNHDEHPELKDITDYVHLRCEAYLASELVSREKGVDGIKFNLSNNYGWSAKREVEVGEKTRKALSIDTMSMAEKLALLKSASADMGDEYEDFSDESEENEETDC